MIPTLALHALTAPCLLRRAREAFQSPLNQLDASELAVMRLSSINPLSNPKGTEQPGDRALEMDLQNTILRRLTPKSRTMHQRISSEWTPFLVKMALPPGLGPGGK